MTDEAVLRKLDELEKEEGELPELLQFYRRIVQIQAGVGERMQAPSSGLSIDAATERLGQGEPLLQATELSFDRGLFLDTLREVTSVFSEYSHLFDLTPEAFTESPPERVVTRDVVDAWFAGKELPSNGAVSGDVLREVVHAAVKPFLVNEAKALIELVDQSKWRRGYCPVCGGNPDFAYLETERGSRHLLCSRCDSEWLFQRLQCPYCNTQSQKDLSYFSDEDGMYRLYVCEKCKHYLKTIDLRKAKSDVEVPAERLLTLGLDAQAREEGYLPI